MCGQHNDHRAHAESEVHVGKLFGFNQPWHHLKPDDELGDGDERPHHDVGVLNPVQYHKLVFDHLAVGLRVHVNFDDFQLKQES